MQHSSARTSVITTLKAVREHMAFDGLCFGFVFLFIRFCGEIIRGGRTAEFLGEPAEKK